MKTWMKWAIAAAAVIVLAVGGLLVWINFIKEDAPEPFALVDPPTSVETTAASGTTLPAATNPEATATTIGATTVAVPAATAEETDGAWGVGAGSAVGYRVVEVLFGVRTPRASGGRTRSPANSPWRARRSPTGRSRPT